MTCEAPLLHQIICPTLHLRLIRAIRMARCRAHRHLLNSAIMVCLMEHTAVQTSVAEGFLAVEATLFEVLMPTETSLSGPCWLRSIAGRFDLGCSRLYRCQGVQGWSLRLLSCEAQWRVLSLKHVGFLQIHLQIRVPPCSNTALGYGAVRGFIPHGTL